MALSGVGARTWLNSPRYTAQPLPQETVQPCVCTGTPVLPHTQAAGAPLTRHTGLPHGLYPRPMRSLSVYTGGCGEVPEPAVSPSLGRGRVPFGGRQGTMFQGPSAGCPSALRPGAQTVNGPGDPREGRDCDGDGQQGEALWGPLWVTFCSPSLHPQRRGHRLALTRALTG